MADLAADPDRLELYSFNVFTQLSGAVTAGMIHLGDRLGLYAALATAGGPLTADELAARCGLDGRWVREWAYNQAAAKLIVADTATGEPTDPGRGAAGGEGLGVILPPAPFRVLVATRPVDFRKGVDGLAALVQEQLRKEPFWAWSTSSAPSGQTEHHSAYCSRSARIEYPWHPLHGRRLRVCQRAVRGGSEVLSLEDRPGLTRELPAWMCDAATCLAMTLGPPLVRVDALSELAATLAALAHDPSARPSSTSSLVKEALDAATDGALANTTHAAPGTRGDQAAACRGVEGAPAGPGRPAPGRPGRGPDRCREEGGR